MKKFSLWAVIVFLLLILQSCEKDNTEKIVTFTDLPKNAQTFLTTYFADTLVLQVIEDKDLFSTSYEVKLSNGFDIDFTKKGEWEKVDCVSSEIPSGIVPTKILEYVNTNHKGLFVVLIEKDKHDYEIDLNNDLDLTFDLDGNFLRYDE